MRIFIYEYLSSGAVEKADAVPSLQAEGWAMLSAVVEDFGRCPGVEVVTLLDAHGELTIGNWPTRLRFGALPSTEERTFRTLAAASDYAVIIAPEFVHGSKPGDGWRAGSVSKRRKSTPVAYAPGSPGTSCHPFHPVFEPCLEFNNILEQRCRWVAEAGCRLLGPSADTVRLTTNKLSLACHFLAQGISTALPFPSPTPQRPNPFTYPAVCKPRCGAGSQATFLVHDDEEMIRSCLQAKDEGWSGEMILQPYVPGLPVSVAFLAGAGQLISLPAVEQHLSTDGRFHYLGGRLPLPPDLDQRARRLAEQAVRSVRGLIGYVGVDLVLGEAADGSTDAVIEINPRLTTSYIGLRRLARFNLAEAMLAVVTGSPLPAFRWNSGPIVFEADGRIPS